MIKTGTLLLGVLVVVAMIVITSVITIMAPYVAGIICLIALLKCYFQRASND